MRYYPDSDVNFFWEISDGWDRYCRSPKNKRWTYKSLDNVRSINYWRDLEGAKLDVITDEDLYIEDWVHDRKRSHACLPLSYSTGSRFIRLSKAEPCGFKCAPLPLGLAEIREILEKEKLEAKKKKDQEKGDKKEKGKKGKK